MSSTEDCLGESQGAVQPLTEEEQRQRAAQYAAYDADMQRARDAGVCWLCSVPMKDCFKSGVIPEWWKDCCCPDCLPRWAWPDEAFVPAQSQQV